MKVAPADFLEVDRTASWGYAAMKVSEGIRVSRNLFPGDPLPWIERRILQEFNGFLVEVCLSIAYPRGMPSPAHQLAKIGALHMFDQCLFNHAEGVDAAIQTLIVTFHMFEEKVQERNFTFSSSENRSLKHLYYFLRGVGLAQASMLEFRRGRLHLPDNNLLDSYFLEH